MNARYLGLVGIAGFLSAAFTATAQDAASERPIDADAVVPLYTSAAPGSESWTWHEEVSIPPWGGRGGRLVRNVVQPTLTLFKPVNAARATRTAVIAFVRSMNQAPKLAKGEKPAVPAAVAKISVSPSENRGIADGIAAVRYVHQHATELGIDPNRIGMVGFSAGGAVTCGTILHGDALSRLDFAAPVYGAFNASGLWPTSTPPLFLAVAGDDPIASQAEIEAFNSLRAQGLPVELHIYEKGGHGFAEAIPR